ALVSPKRGRSGYAGERCKKGPHSVQGEILNLPQPTSLAGENEIADGDASGVEAHHKWRHRSRRHEGACAIHIGDGLGERLCHVRARMKRELEKPDILDGLRLHALNACDVKEVILVVVNEIAFHL